jgi:hypothetical protein
MGLINAKELYESTVLAEAKKDRLRVALPGLIIPVYDSGAVAYPSSAQEVYTFTAAAVVVFVLTINYVDSSKEKLLNWSSL